ncbi:LOW QUALITY PROTEIN: hypothetical protein ACRRTK_019729 [Alexandromys fortis]
MHCIMPKEAKNKLCKARQVLVGTKVILHLVMHCTRIIHYSNPLIKVNGTVLISLDTGNITDAIGFNLCNLCLRHWYVCIKAITNWEHHPVSFDTVHVKDGNSNGFNILFSYIFIICKGSKAVDFSSARKRNLCHLRGRLKAGGEAEGGQSVFTSTLQILKRNSSCAQVTLSMSLCLKAVSTSGPKLCNSCQGLKTSEYFSTSHTAGFPIHSRRLYHLGVRKERPIRSEPRSKQATPAKTQTEEVEQLGFEPVVSNIKFMA